MLLLWFLPPYAGSFRYLMYNSNFIINNLLIGAVLYNDFVPILLQTEKKFHKRKFGGKINAIQVLRVILLFFFFQIFVISNIS